MPWDGRFFRVDEAKEVGAWSRQRRSDTQTTSVDVAEAMDCSHTQVCAWERGAMVPNLATALKLIEAHGYQMYLVRRGSIREQPSG